MKIPEDTRLWTAGGAVVAALILGAGYLLLVGPELSTASDQQTAATAAQVQNATLHAEVTTLAGENKNVSSLVSALRTARTELPIDAGIPAYIDLVTSQAGRARVGITSLSIGAVTAVTSAVGAAAVAPVTGDSGATAATPTPTPTTATADSGTSTAGTGTAGTTATTAGAAGQLFSIQVSVVTHGTMAQQQAFLVALQKPGTRAALVTSTALSADQNSEAASIGSTTDLTTSLEIFAAPQTAAAAAELSKQLKLGTTR